MILMIVCGVLARWRRQYLYFYIMKWPIMSGRLSLGVSCFSATDSSCIQLYVFFCPPFTACVWCCLIIFAVKKKKFSHPSFLFVIINVKF